MNQPRRDTPAKVTAISSSPALAGGSDALPTIKGFLETSFLDWRSKISAVLFLPGCNFRCPFCHNYELVSNPDQYQSLPIDSVMDRLKVFVGWIDGVVITGGEPTLHPGLADLCGLVKEAGFQVKLDTNGYRPWVIEELASAGLVDMVAMDLKAPLEPESYRRVAGRQVDIDRLGRSVEFLKSSGLDHQFRSTIVQPWHGRRQLEAMAASLTGAACWSLQAMDPTTGWDQSAMAGLTPYLPEDLARLQAQLADPVCRPAEPA